MTRFCVYCKHARTGEDGVHNHDWKRSAVAWIRTTFAEWSARQGYIDSVHLARVEADGTNPGRWRARIWCRGGRPDAESSWLPTLAEAQQWAERWADTEQAAAGRRAHAYRYGQRAW